MSLPALVVRLVVVVLAILCLSFPAVVGRDRLARTRADYRDRLREVAPYLLALGGVLLVNSATRELAPEVSWVIGWNVTSTIYAIEGEFVAALQSIAVPPLTAYFSFVYVYGYVFLLVFPLLAYFTLEETRYLRETCVAYAINYGLGLVLYVAFIAYGPRNLIPDVVDPLLYTNWPQSKLLTTQVNTNTNVFPSLHSSLSITVALLAYRTRDLYPRWTGLAVIVAGSVIVSTMYLGIHWLVDVIAGAGLAFVAFRLATRPGVADRDWVFGERVYPFVRRCAHVLKRAVGR